MQTIWDQGTATADQVRRHLEARRELKDSTIRTILRRLEDKGFVDHAVEGRTYLYRALIRPRRAAAEAVRQVVDRLCGGSVEELLLGLVDNQLLSAEQLERLSKQQNSASTEFTPGQDPRE